MFEKFLENDRVAIDNIPLNHIIKKREKLFILLPEYSIEEIDKFFVHLTGKSPIQIHMDSKHKVSFLIAFNKTLTTDEIKKHNIIISNQAQVLMSRRNLAKHFIVFDPTDFTVTHLISPR